MIWHRIRELTCKCQYISKAYQCNYDAQSGRRVRSKNHDHFSFFTKGKEHSFPHVVALLFFFLCFLLQRDHPERGNIHGKGDGWPPQGILPPWGRYVLCQEGMWGSGRRWSHTALLLRGAAVLESPQQNQCQLSLCQLATDCCVDHWDPDSVLSPDAFSVSQM